MELPRISADIRVLALEQSRRAIVIEDSNGKRIKRKKEKRRHTYTFMDNQYYADFAQDIHHLREIDQVLEERRISMQKDLVNNTSNLIRNHELAIKEKKKSQNRLAQSVVVLRSHSAEAVRSPLAQKLIDSSKSKLLFIGCPNSSSQLSKTLSSKLSRIKSSVDVQLATDSLVKHENVSTEEKLNRVRLNRLTIANEKEIQKNAKKRERDEARNKAQEYRAVMLREGLLRVRGFLLAIEYTNRLMTDVIVEKEVRLIRHKGSVRAVAAAAKIQSWWRLTKLRLVIRRNPALFATESSPFRRFITRVAAVTRIRIRREATEIIIYCLKDRTVNMTVRVRQFREKIIMLQGWIRSFLACKDARLRVLSLALEKTEKKRREVLRRRRTNKEDPNKVYTRSRKPDYVETATNIEVVAHRLEEVLVEQELKIRKVRRERLKILSSADRHAAYEATNLERDPIERTWKEKLLSSGHFGSIRLNLIRKVLLQQRKLHVCRFDSLESKRKRQKAIPKVDLAQVKEYLKDFSGQMRIEFSAVKEKDVGLSQTTFLMLTGGGLDEIHYLANSKL